MGAKTQFDRLLASHNLNRRGLAAAMSIAESVVDSWATGERKINTLMAIRIEDRLGIPRGRLQMHLSPLDQVLAEYRLTRRDVFEVLGLTDAAVGKWATEGGRVPAEQAVRIENMLNVPRWKLRPDLWDAPAPATPVESTPGRQPVR